jgi:GMP synthase-like glutamine amidotransferase
MRIHCLQHLAFENPGTIKEWAEEKGHLLSYTYFYEDKFRFPPIGEIDVLLIMGGYMNVDEEQKFPWLVQEKEYIQHAISAGKKIIGICLGAQLIAVALGCKVYPAKEKEIGFFPIQFTKNALEHPFFDHFNNPYTVFHWHGDTFNLLENAQLIASTTTCKNQAYLIGNNVLALQFHLEVNETIVSEMLLHDGHELQEVGSYIQQQTDIKKSFHSLQQNKKDFYLLLDKFLVK